MISQPELTRLLELSQPAHDDSAERRGDRATRIGAVLVACFIASGAGLMLTMLIA